MANITSIDNFDDIYRLETTDKVLGGSGGISNQQAQNLANRTQFLFNRLFVAKKQAGMQILAATTLITNDFAGKEIFVNGASGGIMLTLDAATNFEANSYIDISTYNVSAQITIVGQLQINGNSANAIYLGDSETIRLMTDGNNWFFIPIKYEGGSVGQVLYGYGVTTGTLPLNGQIVNRADYPRLWSFVQAQKNIITDASWVNNINNQGMFSYGDDFYTFRLPDLRGQFVRGFDAGRGLDLYRMANVVGGYELDDNKQHSHVMNGNSNGDSGGEGGIMVSSFKGFEKINDTNTANNVTTKRTVEYAGTEARPKNIALIPLIKI